MRLGRDGLAGLIGFGFSALLFWQSLALPASPLVPVGPGFYPRIVLVLVALASLALIGQDLLAGRGGTTPAADDRPDNDRPDNDRRPRSDYARVGLGFLMVAAYVLLLPYLGFRLATVLFLAAMQAMIELPRTARQWAVVVTVAVATTVVTYLVFERYLSVLLPRGLWTGW